MNYKPKPDSPFAKIMASMKPDKGKAKSKKGKK
jgi:hypothetical protein